MERKMKTPGINLFCYKLSTSVPLQDWKKYNKVICSEFPLSLPRGSTILEQCPEGWRYSGAGGGEASTGFIIPAHKRVQNPLLSSAAIEVWLIPLEKYTSKFFCSVGLLWSTPQWSVNSQFWTKLLCKSS